MKLVFINQYFPPDAAPTGLMLEDVAAQLTEQGHEVTVICARGGYAESSCNDTSDDEKQYRVVRIGATGIGRKTFLGKLVDYAGFYFGVAWQLLFLNPRADRIIALTTPPFLSILARLVSRIRGGDHAHWVMDLYPDVMVAHGMIREGRILHRFLSSLTRWGFGGERCAGVWSLGPDMKERVDFYLENHIYSEWIPLWGAEGKSEQIDQSAKELRGKRGWADEDLVLMYSGNLGLGHSFSEVLTVASSQELSGEGKTLRFSFHGSGKRRVEVEQFLESHPSAPVELHGYEDGNLLRAHLRSADLHLVSLNPTWDGTMVPSKLQGIFAVGRPVIFIGSEDCAIGQWIKESGGGWVVAAGDVDGLRQVLREAGNENEQKIRGEAALRFSSEAFSKDTNVRKYADGFSRDTGISVEK